MRVEYRCNVADDNDEICGVPISKHQWDQDGMCQTCADAIWNFFFGSLDDDEPPPIIHPKDRQKD